MPQRRARLWRGGRWPTTSPADSTSCSAARHVLATDVSADDSNSFTNDSPARRVKRALDGRVGPVRATARLSAARTRAVAEVVESDAALGASHRSADAASRRTKSRQQLHWLAAAAEPRLPARGRLRRLARRAGAALPAVPPVAGSEGAPARRVAVIPLIQASRRSRPWREHCKFDKAGMSVRAKRAPAPQPCPAGRAARAPRGHAARVRRDYPGKPGHKGLLW
jgi:hypothetical protein